MNSIRTRLDIHKMKYVATFLVLFAGVCVSFTVAARYGQNQGGGEHSQSSSQSNHSGHCYHTSECPDCSSHLARHCLNYQCICTASTQSATTQSGCHSERQCIHHECDDDETPYCRLNSHNNRESDSHSHSSCHCRATTHSVGTYTSSDCKQHSDCASHACPNDRPIPYCHHDYLLVIDLGRHCHCMAPTSTSTDGTTTAGSTTPALTTRVISTTISIPPSASVLSTSGCHDHTDCGGHPCPLDKHPYCKIDRYSSTCDCTDCTEHKHCFCPQGLVGQCHFDYIHNSHSCVCALRTGTRINTGTATTSTTTETTTKSEMISTTISIPPSASVLSTSGCHDHTDCGGHPCPFDKHPYCKIDRYFSTCDCTDCTEHKHCFCPQGLVGQCHFDYIYNSHSCVCALRTETTIKSMSATTTTTATTTKTGGFLCPTCDEALNCVWNQACYPEEICMIRQYPGTNFTTHCSRKEDCTFMKNVLPKGEIFCCSDRECLRRYLGM